VAKKKKPDPKEIAEEVAEAPERPLMVIDISDESSALVARGDRLAGLQGRLEGLLEKAVDKLCDQIENPDWRPNPGDVIQLINLLTTIDGVGVRYLQLVERLVASKKALEELGEAVSTELKALHGRSALRVVKSES